VCASHCAQLLHTILHRTDLIVFPLTLQTITTARMMSIWGKRTELLRISDTGCYRPDGLPITQPTVSKHWRKLTALTHTHNCFTALFLGLPDEPVPEKSSSGLYGTRGDIRGRHTNNPAGRHSIRTNQWPISSSPFLLPDSLPPATLPIYPGLGQAPNMLACILRGLVHTQWLGAMESHSLALTFLHPPPDSTKERVLLPLRLYLMSTSNGSTPDHPKIYTTVSCIKAYPSQHFTQIHKRFDSSRDRWMADRTTKRNNPSNGLLSRSARVRWYQVKTFIYSFSISN